MTIIQNKWINKEKQSSSIKDKTPSKQQTTNKCHTQPARVFLIKPWRGGIK